MRVKMAASIAVAIIMAAAMGPASPTPGEAQPRTITPATVVDEQAPTPQELATAAPEAPEQAAAAPPEATATLTPTPPPPQEEVGWQDFTATWYDMGTTTRTGTHVTEGRTIAVDPKVIPLGATVEVKFSDGSTHRYQAEDTGSAIKGNRIDIYDHSETRCFQNGRQRVQIRVIPGDG